MTTPSDTSAEPLPGPRPAAPAALAATRPLYWSVRREVWENRSLYVAPLVAAAIVLFAVLIGTTVVPHRMRAIAAIDPARQAHMIAAGFDFAAIVILLTGMIVGAFYCLGALHNERRDRSILFWKSLPVSDLTTVLAKASVPMLVLPAILFAVVLALQLAMLLLCAVVLPSRGIDARVVWARAPLFHDLDVLAWGLISLALWYAPIWGWLLMVSAWARRAPFLWAVLPPLAVCIVEKIAFDTDAFASMLRYRLGGFDEAFTVAAHSAGVFGSPRPDVAGFLTTPGLWVGLAAAAGFLAAAVWLRRRREPI